MKVCILRNNLETHQIQISCFSRHFYVVKLILLSVLHFWTKVDTKKNLFIFYGPFFKAMSFSVCPEVIKNISNRLVCTAVTAQVIILIRRLIFVGANRMQHNRLNDIEGTDYKGFFKEICNGKQLN